MRGLAKAHAGTSAAPPGRLPGPPDGRTALHRRGRGSGRGGKKKSSGRGREGEDARAALLLYQRYQKQFDEAQKKAISTKHEVENEDRDDEKRVIVRIETFPSSKFKSGKESNNAPR